MSRSRANAEKQARSLEDDRGVPLGSAVIRRDRPEAKHFLIRFPWEAIDREGLEDGDELRQYYDPLTNELRIPLDD